LKDLGWAVKGPKSKSKYNPPKDSDLVAINPLFNEIINNKGSGFPGKMSNLLVKANIYSNACRSGPGVYYQECLETTWSNERRFS